MTNPFKTKHKTIHKDGETAKVERKTNLTSRFNKDLAGMDMIEVEVIPGKRVTRAANSAKLVVMHDLLGILADDDVDSVFIQIVNVMAARGFRFTKPALDLLTALEVANKD